MAGRALWRRNPDDPRTAVGWAFADARRVLYAAREDLGCVGTMAAIGLFATHHPVAGIALFVVPRLLPRLARKPRSIEPILTLPLSAPAFPCEIEAKREGATIGVDRGVVTFIEGWLHFEGFRTTFSLSRADVRKRDRNALEFEDDGGVEFHPDDTLCAASIDRTGLQKEFAGALDRWYRLGPSAEGRSVLPSLLLHPSGVARTWVDLAYGLVKVALGLAAIFWWVAALHGVGWFVFFVCGFTGSAIDALGHLRRIRRFARESRKAIPNDPKATLGL